MYYYTKTLFAVNENNVFSATFYTRNIKSIKPQLKHNTYNIVLQNKKKNSTPIQLTLKIYNKYMTAPFKMEKSIAHVIRIIKLQY